MNINSARWILAAASLVLLTSNAAAETYVIPVVVPGVAGKNGSYWETEVRIIRLSAVDPVTVRRSWVALPGGGFVDNLATAPTWVIQSPNEPPKLVDMLILTGEQLLAGVSATHAAVGLDIEGEALVHWRSANTEGQERLPHDRPLEEACCWPGSGQFGAALTTPLRGGSTIPWVTSGRGVFRTNLGLINPTGTTARFQEVRIAPLLTSLVAPHLTSLSTPVPTGLSTGARRFSNLRYRRGAGDRSTMFSPSSWPPCRILCPELHLLR